MRNVFELVGAKLPGGVDRQPMANRRRGLGALALGVVAGVTLPIAAARNYTTEQTCVVTNGALTAWDNGYEAAQELKDRGANIVDFRAVTDEVTSPAQGIEVCVEQPAGIVGKAVAFADITNTQTRIHVTPSPVNQ